MKPDISVIIPVYNVEKYLHRCLTSVINQNFQNIEIVIVNDGSTDLSGNICDEIAGRDSRITVIHKANGGLSSARNAGIEVARGKYIGFVDSDDWISQNMYEYLYKIIKDSNADIAQVCEYSTDRETLLKNNPPKETILSGKSRLSDYFLEAQYSVCVRLFKREVFEGIRFPEGKINEDIVTNYLLLINSTKVVRSNQKMYFYFRNPGSITNNKLTNRDYDLFDACQELCNLTNDDTELGKLAKIKFARSYFSLLMKGYVFGIDKTIDKRKFVKNCVKNIRRNYILLINSNIALNRKLLITISVLHPKLLEIITSFALKIRYHYGVKNE
ncbi:hypothetical protein ASG89_11875 [Paenibacillus sp. Soil766]|uniref:glycosyltransferase family 2 protein n=1 Tax=Paenibacillus sp. Soil766 TaxID=1736404 RepID=UPI00070EC0BF|nr:glycosyltransferase [Paenibacillus sp. Soil766]KRE83811.1 hypothetical protein ASG89_11875 [Paenibacillus sp. Soil766]